MLETLQIARTDLHWLNLEQKSGIMSSIDLNRPDDIQRDSIEDFFEDFREAYENCETILIDLEHKPDDQNLLNGLFRVVHTIKGNLGFIGLFSLIPLLQSLEDVLDDIRKGHMAYDSALCDVILQSLDRTKGIVNAKMDNQQGPLTPQKISYISARMTELTSIDAGARAVCIQHILLGLNPATRFDDLPQQTPTAPVPTASAVTATAAVEDPLMVWRRMLQLYGIPQDEDTMFFAGLVQSIENRSTHWQGRTARQLFLCLEMNRQAGNKVDKDQLAIAVMLHDLGMAFLPHTLFNQQGQPDPSQLSLWQRHAEHCASLLASSPRWQEAAAIIWQHHEHVDGSGFPDGLEGDDIADGAKILRIADEFDARPQDSEDPAVARRHMMKAVLDINNQSGKTFDTFWVDIFNQVVRAHHQHFAR